MCVSLETIRAPLFRLRGYTMETKVRLGQGGKVDLLGLKCLRAIVLMQG